MTYGLHSALFNTTLKHRPYDTTKFQIKWEIKCMEQTYSVVTPPIQNHLRIYWLMHICHIDSLILSPVVPLHDTLSRQTMGPYHATYGCKNAPDRSVSGCYLCCSVKPCLPPPRTKAHGNGRDMH